jgi:hypothetical protein
MRTDMEYFFVDRYGYVEPMRSVRDKLYRYGVPADQIESASQSARGRRMLVSLLKEENMLENPLSRRTLWIMGIGAGAAALGLGLFVLTQSNPASAATPTPSPTPTPSGGGGAATTPSSDNGSTGTVYTGSEGAAGTNYTGP